MVVGSNTGIKPKNKFELKLFYGKDDRVKLTKSNGVDYPKF